jgi:predicted esterase
MHSRRDFLKSSVAATAALLAGCTTEVTGPATLDEIVTVGARPHPPARSLSPGRHPLGVDWVRDGFIYVPESYRPAIAAPLVVLLHGAGGMSSNWSDGFLGAVDDLGIVVMGADSRGGTWDLIQLLGFGPDVHFIDLAMARTFEACNIDPARVAIAGFSDGASYALSLGMCNGDLFKFAIGFSPGYIDVPRRQGSPKLFISHGTKDPVIPVTVNRDNYVPALRSAGYDVTYREFDGGHTVVRTLAHEAFAMVAAG